MSFPLLRKGQVQLMEVIAVMIILVIIVVIIATTASYYASTSGTTEDLEAQRERAQRAAQTLRTRTELRCPSHITETALCVDGIRAKSTKQIIEANATVEQTYFDLFGPVTLTIDPIHPTSHPITIYNQTPQNYTSAQPINTPMTYFNATTNTKHFAILTTTLYR